MMWVSVAILVYDGISKGNYLKKKKKGDKYHLEVNKAPFTPRNRLSALRR